MAAATVTMDKMGLLTLLPLPSFFSTSPLQEEGFADTTSKEGRSPQLLALGKKFARVHGMSSTANLLIFLAAIVQLYVLSSKHVTFAATTPAVKASFWGW
jgi:hypothetical protein